MTVVCEVPQIQNEWTCEKEAQWEEKKIKARGKTTFIFAEIITHKYKEQFCLSNNSRDDEVSFDFCFVLFLKSVFTCK